MLCSYYDQLGHSFTNVNHYHNPTEYLWEAICMQARMPVILLAQSRLLLEFVAQICKSKILWTVSKTMFYAWRTISRTVNLELYVVARRTTTTDQNDINSGFTAVRKQKWPGFT